MWSLELFFLNTETISLPTPVDISLLKVNDRNTRTRCEIYLKLTIKTPERRQLRSSNVFIVNFEHVSHFVLMFLLRTLNMELPNGTDISKIENIFMSYFCS